jgi:hypothetical protein
MHYDFIAGALDFLIIAIALGFAAIMLIDFIAGAHRIFKASAIPASSARQAEELDSSQPSPPIIDDPWTQPQRKRPIWASMGTIEEFTQDLLLPPAPTTADIEALEWASIKLLAKGRVKRWNQMKKKDLIQAIVEAQITWRDLAALNAA